MSRNAPGEANIFGLSLHNNRAYQLTKKYGYLRSNISTVGSVFLEEFSDMYLLEMMKVLKYL